MMGSDEGGMEEGNKENGTKVGNGKTALIELPVLPPTPTVSAYRKAGDPGGDHANILERKDRPDKKGSSSEMVDKPSSSTQAVSTVESREEGRNNIEDRSYTI